MTASPRSVRFDDNSLWVDLTDGRVIAADFVIVGIGVTPETGLAAAAGPLIGASSARVSSTSGTRQVSASSPAGNRSRK